MSLNDELERARVQVLVDNTAQAVFKHLDRLEDNRKLLELRWIWELLQNARDAARPDGVHIKIRLSDSTLRFEHDGEPFRPREIAHLVYHGSTKIERSDPVGRFGSGFLSTHLLSRSVRVGGCLKDLSGFDFLLDRTGNNVQELHASMDRSWEAFQQSLRPGQEVPTSTSFSYDEITEHGQLAHEGVAALRQCGPLVLAFCPDIVSIAVEVGDNSWSLRRGHPTRMDGGSILEVQCQQDGQMSSRFVAVAEGEPGIQVALQLRPSEAGGLQVDPDLVSTPKLFILFPLIGSERLGLPASINSMEFKPHEDRNGVVLAGVSEGAEKNRHLLQESMQYQKRILNWCAQNNWGGTDRLLAFDTDNLPDWVRENKQWFIELLADLFRHARETPLMPTRDGDWINLQDAWIPTTDDPSHREQLGDLMASWDEAPARLPCRDHLDSWSRNLANWSRLLGQEPSDMDEARTIEAVAKLANRAGSIEGVQERLLGDIGLSWLISLLRLVQDAKCTRLFDEYKLLPSQAGCLKRRLSLSHDQEISDKLKDIAEGFEIKIRNGLLDTRVADEVEGIAGHLPRKSESDLLTTIRDRVEANCHNDQSTKVPRWSVKSDLVPGVIKLFRWMVKQEYNDTHLRDYPLPTTDENEGRTTIFRLDSELDTSHKPLAPRSTWPRCAQNFSTLFSKRKILAEAFASGDAVQWRKLRKQGYVNISPLIETQCEEIKGCLPEEPLSDEPDSHELTQGISVSNVVFLTEKNVGLIDRVRKSENRATELIHFILKFVIPTDEMAFEVVGSDCECGEPHTFHRAAWLKPLHDRSWVPAKNSDGRTISVRPSAESLSRLLTRSPDITQLLLGEQGTELLRVLGIRPADIMLRSMTDDEDLQVGLIGAMKDLYEAAGCDARSVYEVADEIRERPEIITSIREQKERRKTIQRNQAIGSFVEDLLRQELEQKLKGRGLKVCPRRVGADIAVEHDYTRKNEGGDNEEIMLEVVDQSAGAKHSRCATLIEVKSTKGKIVKMTPPQVESSCSRGDHFALCVVPLDDKRPTRATVRERARFVFGIGESLKSAWMRYEDLRDASKRALQIQDDAIEIEIREGQVRFRIGSEIWSGQESLKFQQTVERLIGGR
ncbi:MAG: ATP-binding protein [Acidobacteriota bacterium]|nr:ATP-binding protein [Acidobacteriota bacterium]